jgi:hypothetical protein
MIEPPPSGVFERSVRAGWVRVAETFTWDLIDASSLLLGGLLVLGLPGRRHALGLVMAFGRSVLIPYGNYQGLGERTRSSGHFPAEDTRL